MSRNLARKTSSILPILVAMSMGGCGGSDDAASLSAPIGAIAGVWQITESSVTGTCGDPLNPPYNAVIAQNGNTINAVVDGDTFLAGTISAGAFSLSGTNFDLFAGATVTANASGTVAASCNSITGGTINYTAAPLLGGASCTGAVVFTATRTLGSGCAGTLTQTAVAETSAANNTRLTAQAVTTIPARISGAHSSGTDDDFYGFTLSASTPVTIMLTGPAASLTSIQELDLALYDNTTGALIATSANLFSNEAIAQTLLAGSYAVWVEPVSITGTPAYTLVIQ